MATSPRAVNPIPSESESKEPVVGNDGAAALGNPFDSPGWVPSTPVKSMPRSRPAYQYGIHGRPNAWETDEDDAPSDHELLWDEIYKEVEEEYDRDNWHGDDEAVTSEGGDITAAIGQDGNGTMTAPEPVKEPTVTAAGTNPSPIAAAAPSPVTPMAGTLNPLPSNMAGPSAPLPTTRPSCIQVCRTKL